MEELTHEMKLLGLKMPHGDEIASYFDDLPKHFTKCIDFRDLYKLKDRKRKEIKDNLVINTGMDIIIYDPQADRFFYRTLKHYTNMNSMLKYFRDGNLFILRDELRAKEEPEDELPAPQSNPKTNPEKNDNTQLLF